MTLHFTRKTAPTTWPVTIDDIKLQARISHTSEDALIDTFIRAAADWIEAYTQRSLSTQTWQASMADFVDALWLPRAAPLTSVTFVKYYDTSNVLQTLSSSYYTVPSFVEPAQIRLAYDYTWPSVYDRADAVRVEYITGYADGECPEPLRQALAMLAAHWFEHREAVLVGTISKPVEFAVEALCAPYRLWWQEPICR